MTPPRVGYCRSFKCFDRLVNVDHQQNGPPEEILSDISGERANIPVPRLREVSCRARHRIGFRSKVE